MPNYVTKSNVKEAAGVDTSMFAEITDLTSSKSDVNKLDIRKLETVPDDLSKLGDVVKMKLLQKL